MLAPRGRPIGQLRLRVRFADQVGPWFSYWHLTPGALEAVVDGTPSELEQMVGTGSYVATLRRGRRA